MPDFAELVASRKAWIANFLEPWCRSAARRELRTAAQEWNDIAGKVDPEKTLWYWAWSRFPALVNTRLNGIDETHPVTVKLRSGGSYSGYPDARQSRQGELVLVCRGASQGSQPAHEGPFSIDEIISVDRA